MIRPLVGSISQFADKSFVFLAFGPILTLGWVDPLWGTPRMVQQDCWGKRLSEIPVILIAVLFLAEYLAKI